MIMIMMIMTMNLVTGVVEIIMTTMIMTMNLVTGVVDNDNSQ